MRRVGGGTLINNRRSELQILTDILHMTNGSVNKTKILYQANLSYTQMEKYLAFLIDKGLLEKKSDSSGTFRIYRTTERGLEFLAICKKLRLFLEERFTGFLKHTSPTKPSIDATKSSTSRPKKDEEKVGDELWKRLLKILPSEAEAETFLKEKGYLPIEKDNAIIQRWEKTAIEVRKREKELQRLKEDLRRIEGSLKEKIPCVQ